MQNKKIKILTTLSLFVLTILSISYIGPNLKKAVGQNTTYPVSLLTGAGDVNFSLSTQAVEFRDGKWTYNFSWKRTREAEGRLTISPSTNELAYITDLDPAPREKSVSSPLVVKLDPATRYVVKYYSGPSSLCDRNNPLSDPECAVIRSVYFNTRNESGKIMSVSEIPISRGGTMVGSDNTGTTLTGDTSLAGLQAQVNQLLALVQSLIARLAGQTSENPLAMCDYSPAPTGCSYVNGPSFNSVTQCGKVLQCGSTTTNPITPNTFDPMRCFAKPTPSGCMPGQNGGWIDLNGRLPDTNTCTCADGKTTVSKVGSSCDYAKCPLSGNISTCQAVIGQNKFVAPNGASSRFTVSPQLAQEMKTWERCHYATGGAGFNHKDPNGNTVHTVSLVDQRRYAQECADLFVSQARRLGFDEATCSVGEYCGVGDSSPDGTCSANQIYMGRATSCKLREGDPNGTGWETFVGEASSVVGNDFGNSNPHGEPQGWYQWLWSFNAELARKETAKYTATGEKPFDVVFDATKNVFRPAVTNSVATVPQACMGVVNVSVNKTSDRTGTVSWQAPDSTRNVSVYLVTKGMVAGRENEIRIEATLGENISNRAGINTLNFTIPPDTSLPVPGQVQVSSILYGGLAGGALDQMVQRERANFFVRVVADTGVFGDSGNIFLNGQSNTSLDAGDYGTRINPPPSPSFNSSCESALLSLNFNTSNTSCNGITSSLFNVNLPVTTAWFPNNFSNAKMVLRVAEDNGGRGEQAVRGGCANPADCFMKIDDIWQENRYIQSFGDFAGGSFAVNGLKPGTRYWFRAAAVCNPGQSNQTYKDEVWSCTTAPASGGSCSSECSTGQTKCMANTRGVRQLCGNFDSDSCLEWGSGSVPGAEGVAFRFDSTCN